MTHVDARGDACPLPVVKAKRAISELKGAGQVEILVDNEIAVQNLTRMAAGHHLEAKAEKRSEGAYAVTMEVKTPVGDAPAEEPEGVTVTDTSGYYRMTFCPGNLVYYYMDDYWNFWFQGTGEAELYPLLLEQTA